MIPESVRCAAAPATDASALTDRWLPRWAYPDRNVCRYLVWVFPARHLRQHGNGHDVVAGCGQDATANADGRWSLTGLDTIISEIELVSPALDSLEEPDEQRPCVDRRHTSRKEEYRNGTRPWIAWRTGTHNTGCSFVGSADLGIATAQRLCTNMP
jgi:hypothetical protein